MVLNETKLNSCMKWVTKLLLKDLPECQHHSSGHNNPDITGMGCGGGIILIKGHYATTINNVDVQPEPVGHLFYIVLPTNGSYTHIMGVYMSGDEATTQEKVCQSI